MTTCSYGGRRPCLFACLVMLLWVSGAAAQFQAGSLEFIYSTPPDPVGGVSFNYAADGDPPFISYQIPANRAGRFSAPWLILVGEGGEVIADTIIVLTNPDDVATLNLQVMLWSAEGVLDVGCTKQITLGPKATVKRSTRVLFASCPQLP